MSILKKALNEINNVMDSAPGIYDMQGHPIKGILGSDRYRNGTMNNYNTNYLLPNQLIALFNRVTGYNIKIDTFNIIRDDKKVSFLPTGYYVNNKQKKYKVYSLGRFYDIMLLKNTNGRFYRDSNSGKYILSSYGEKFIKQGMEITQNKKEIKKQHKKESEEKKWEANRAQRLRYDKDE